MPDTSQSSSFSSKPKFVNNVGHVHPVTKDAQKEAKEYSQKIGNLTKNFGFMPSSDQVRENFKGYLIKEEKMLEPQKINNMH